MVIRNIIHMLQVVIVRGGREKSKKKYTNDIIRSRGLQDQTNIHAIRSINES